MTSAASAMPATVTALPSGTQLPTSTSGVGSTSQTLNENDFFQLLTAQLEHQDPLNPLTGAEFAAELAQFSTASGVQNLTAQAATTSGIQAAGLVGHNVAVSGNALLLGQNGAATGAFNLSTAATNVAVTITDPAGNKVASVSLGATAAGSQTFSWDGTSASGGSRLLPGTYAFSVSAVGATGTAVTATPYAVAPVTGVALGGQSGPLLDLGGGLTPVALSAVQQIF
jgi:flagellar basal-body rod modification protein FlgD